jgi:2,4-dienoyl-CoA reductase (NADPH2)
MRLFDPIRVGPLELDNRIVMGSMHTGLESGGEAEFQRLAGYFHARAKGGAGLMVTGGFSPNSEGNLGAHAAELNEAALSRHRIVTDAVRAAGGKIFVQILHAGRYSKHKDLVAPSAVRAPINKFEPREMSEADILRTIDDFGHAAELAMEAGYHGVEIMGSEGYLLTQFLCQRTNRREDEWGGTFDNRARLAREVVARARKAIGDAGAIAFRISALDLVEGGSTAEEISACAAMVEAAGADMLTTGIGWHEARVPTIAQAVPPAAFTFATARLRKAVSIPVAASNRINTAELAEDVLAKGEADMVMLARPFLADAAFAAKARDGRGSEINVCIACNQACLDRIFSGKTTGCLVNPAVTREAELAPKPAKHARQIAVIGGGVAGLAAAATAAERGHAVTLFEAADKLGGQFNLAARIPGKAIFTRTISQMAGRIEQAGGTIRLSTRPTPTEIGADFEAAILATGVTPRTPDIEGIDHPSVARYDEILSGARTAGQRVAIIGAGGIGFDVALFLTEQNSRAHEDPAAFRSYWGIDAAITDAGGLAEPVEPRTQHQVTLLKRSDGRFGRSLGLTTGWVHQIELKRAGVEMLADVTYQRIDEVGLHVESEGEIRLIEADTIILCAGQVSVLDLAEPLAASEIEVQVIGGAKLAGELDAERAIEEGTLAGLTV